MKSPARILPDELLARLAREHGTPLFVYRAETVLERVARLAAFDRIRYAQKANSNLSLLALLRAAGVQVDAVSAGEVERALRVGWTPAEIVFTADLFDRESLRLAGEHDLQVNLGSAFMIAQYARVRPGGRVTLRVNPGFGHGHDQKVSTGGEHSKHGIWHAALGQAVEECRRQGLSVTGLHMHIGSGADLEHLQRVCAAMQTAARLCPGELRSISAGGGLPVPYREGEPEVDLPRYIAAWLEARERISAEVGRRLELEVEPGRYLVAEAGLLLAEVRGTKKSGGVDYLMVDAGFHNLVRPAMYGAWHGISVLGRDGEPLAPRVVAGPLCESADVFTQKRGGVLDPRPLPAAREGDLLCIHDCGAYAASMSSGYNTQPLAAEVLVEQGVARLVRRRQTIEELLRPESECLPGWDGRGAPGPYGRGAPGPEPA